MTNLLDSAKVIDIHIFKNTKFCTINFGFQDTEKNHIKKL